MSDKPQIYGNCKAGCLWETVHKEDFLSSAAMAEIGVDEYGLVEVDPFKKYKIHSGRHLFDEENNIYRYNTSVYLATNPEDDDFGYYRVRFTVDAQKAQGTDYIEYAITIISATPELPVSVPLRILGSTDVLTMKINDGATVTDYNGTVTVGGEYKFVMYKWNSTYAPTKLEEYPVVSNVYKNYLMYEGYGVNGFNVAYDAVGYHLNGEDLECTYEKGVDPSKFKLLIVNAEAVYVYNSEADMVFMKTKIVRCF